MSVQNHFLDQHNLTQVVIAMLYQSIEITGDAPVFFINEWSIQVVVRHGLNELSELFGIAPKGV